MEKTSLPNQKPDLIIFDLDETILDHTDILKQEIYDAFAAATDKQYRSIGAQISKLGKKQHHAHIKLRMMKDWVLAKHPGLKEYAKKLGDDFSEAAIKASRPVLYPGFPKFIEQISAQKIETHLVTRAHPAWLERISKEQNLPVYFESIRSTRAEPELVEKQQAFAEIINNFKNRTGRAPSVWIVGDNVSDYPDSHFMQAEANCSDIQLIAVSKTCQAYDWLSHASGSAHYIGSYTDASQHFSGHAP